MKIVISNITKRALMSLSEDLGDCKYWLSHEELVDSEFDLYTVTLEEYVILKANSDRITIESRGRLSFIESDEFERIEII